MDAAFWPAVVTVATLMLGKLLDSLLNRRKESREDRSGAMSEVKDVWSRNDTLEERLDKCKASLADEKAARKDEQAAIRSLEQKLAEMTQRLTAALLELDYWRRGEKPPPELTQKAPANG